MSRFFCLKSSVIILLILFLCYPTKSQNLVINPSFEDTLLIFNPYVERRSLFNAKAWKEINTANYYWYGNLDGLRNSKVIETKARTGSCFAGIYIKANSHFRNREFIIGELINPLMQGCNYKISLYVKFSKEFKYILKELDVSFSELTPISLSDSKCFTIKTNDKISDGWILFNGEYKATGNERYFTIGSWNNSLKMYKNRNRNDKKEGIYLYIDDVAVIPADSCHLNKYITKTVHNKHITETHLNKHIRKTNIDTTSEITNFAKSIYYQPNSFEIDTLYYAYLDSIADVLRNDESFFIEIVGFTDSIGRITYNKDLSNLRAQEVVKYFEKKGINKIRIKSYGLGICPEINNEKWENRKVDIIITKEKLK